MKTVKRLYGWINNRAAAYCKLLMCLVCAVNELKIKFPLRLAGPVRVHKLKYPKQQVVVLPSACVSCNWFRGVLWFVPNWVNPPTGCRITLSRRHWFNGTQKRPANVIRQMRIPFGIRDVVLSWWQVSPTWYDVYVYTGNYIIGFS